MNFVAGEEVTLKHRIPDGEAWVTFDGARKHSGPKYGRVYKISDTMLATVQMLFFEEFGSHVCYDSRLFRRVVKRSTDISIFTKVLDKKFTKVTV